MFAYKLVQCTWIIIRLFLTVTLFSLDGCSSVLHPLIFKINKRGFLLMSLLKLHSLLKKYNHLLLQVFLPPIHEHFKGIVLQKNSPREMPQC